MVEYKYTNLHRENEVVGNKTFKYWVISSKTGVVIKKVDVSSKDGKRVSSIRDYFEERIVETDKLMAKTLYEDKALDVTTICKQMQISRSTFYRLVNVKEEARV